MASQNNGVGKALRQIIKDFYAQWIAAHPEKRVWNKSLKAYIYVKFQSINESLGHAPVSYESTKAVLNLTDLLSMAVKVKYKKAKTKVMWTNSMMDLPFVFTNGQKVG